MSTDELPIRAIIVDDHPMLREGTRSVLQQAGIDVVGVAESGEEGVRLVARHRPDVLILDVRLPDISGVDVARRVRLEFRDVKILIVTGYDDVGYARALLPLGVQGYLRKSASGSDIVAAVRSIVAGKTAIEADVIRDAQHGGIEPLTNRELQVLRLLAAGRRNAEIANELGLSEKTVEYHLTHILEKLHARSRVQAILIAQDYGLIDLN